MKKQKKVSVLKRLLPYMGKKKFLFPVSLGFSGVSSVLNLLPFVFLWFIAREFFAGSGEPDMGRVNLYAWLTLASAGLAMLMYFAALMASHLAAFRVEVGMRKVGMERIISMPLGFFDTVSSGKMRKVIDDNASQTHTFLAHQLPDLSGTILAPLVLFVLMFVVDWRLGLVSFIPLVLGMISSSSMMTEKGKAFRKVYLDKLEEMSSEAVEYVRGIPVVKTFGQSVFSFKRFVASITEYKDMVYAYTVSFNKVYSFFQVIMQTAAFFLVPFALLFIGRGENLGLVITDFIFYLLVAPSFTVLFMRSMYFKNNASIAEEAINRFDALLKYPEMVFEDGGELPSGNSIEFKNVVFAYDGSDKNAVDGISFTVAEGERIALVGASGGGKTTIARLAARFWDVTSGDIFIGGVNVKDISKYNLMEKISFVFQNTKLFKTSLRENIVYGKEGISEADIDRALELSQSKEIIDYLDDGLDTVIGAEGTYLSGGEQQRIALARAILKNAPIVLLDEATAFADPENEHLIQKALRELSKGKTSIMIAHRLTSVQDVDRILVVDKGKIVESGSHSELLARGALYKTMWNEYQKSVEWRVLND